MTPQHYLTAAPGLGQRESETASNPMVAGWTALGAGPQLGPRSAGNHQEAKALEDGMWLPEESLWPYQFDEATWQAAETLDWLDREYWSEPVQATIAETPLPTGDAMAIFYDRDDRPRAHLRTWGQPDTATTTQSALKWRVGAGSKVQPPEFAPPNYEPDWLDIAFMGWTWKTRMRRNRSNQRRKQKDHQP